MPTIFNKLAALLSATLAKGGKTSKDTVAYLASKMSTRVVTLCLLPVWTSLLSPAEFGTLGTIGAWAGVITPLMLMGLPSAILRFCPEKLCGEDERQAALSTAWVLIAVSSLSIFAISLFLGPWLWEVITSGKIPFFPLVPMAIAGAALTTTGRLVGAGRLSARDTRSVLIIEQATSTLPILVAVVAVWYFDRGVFSYLSAGLLTAGVTTAFLLSRYVKKGVHFDRAVAVKCLAYGVPLVPQALAAWVLNLSDRVIIEWHHPLSQSGIYNLAANFGMIMSFLAVSIAQATTPKVFAAMSDSTISSRTQIRQMAVATLGMLAVCSLGMMALAPLLLTFIANVRYESASDLLVPVIAGYFLFGVYQMFLRPMLFQKRTVTVAIFTLVAAVLNVGLNLIFIPSGGPMAAAMTTAVSYFVAAMISWFVSRRLDKMELDVAYIALLVGIPLGCAYLFHNMAPVGWDIFLLRGGLAVIGAGSVAAVCFLQMKKPISSAQNLTN